MDIPYPESLRERAAELRDTPDLFDLESAAMELDKCASMIEARFAIDDETVESATMAMDEHMERYPNAAHEEYVRAALAAVWPVQPNKHSTER